MRRLLARILRIPSARREERLLTQAMLSAPMPIPPTGLRDRLLADALVAAQQVSPQQRRSRVWMAWAAPVALVIAIAWLAFGGRSEKQINAPGRGSQNMAAGPSVPAHPQPGPSTPSEDTKVFPDRKQMVRPHVHRVEQAPKHPPRPHPVSEKRLIPRQPSIVTDADVVPEEPAIRVSVSRTREGNTGYARASSQNEDGTRTEWAILEGDEACQQNEVCMTGDTGMKLCVTVSSLADSTDRLEDRL